MGFLDKLWDETLAGPKPETGLGKLRKYNSFSAGSAIRSPVTAENVPISRSITLVRANSTFRTITSTTSEPASPSSGSITPRTPLTPETPDGDFKKFTRRKSSGKESAEHRSLTIYDWVIMSALDRC